MLTVKFFLLNEVCNLYNTGNQDMLPTDTVQIIKRFLFRYCLFMYDKDKITEFIMSNHGYLNRLHYVSRIVSNFLLSSSSTTEFLGMNSSERACLYKLGLNYDFSVEKGEKSSKYDRACNKCFNYYHYCTCKKFMSNGNVHDVIIRR
jgi:hypothetical protein